MCRYVNVVQMPNLAPTEVEKVFARFGLPVKSCRAKASLEQFPPDAGFYTTQKWCDCDSALGLPEPRRERDRDAYWAELRAWHSAMHAAALVSQAEWIGVFVADFRIGSHSIVDPVIVRSVRKADDYSVEAFSNMPEKTMLQLTRFWAESLSNLPDWLTNPAD